MKLNTKKTLLAACTLAIIMGILMLAIIGCAPRTADDGKEQPEQEDALDTVMNVPINWSMQSDCGICHTNEASGATDDRHPQAVAHADISCTECHTDEQVLAKTHDGVTMADKPASKVTEITVDANTCISCHGTLEEVASLTAASEALRDDQGLVVNPHQRPDGLKHAENPATCTSYHNNHAENLNREAKKYCASCHHRGIWQCGTCHELRD